MKNCIVFFIVFKLTALSVAAQMPQSNWPKFIRWDGNAQIVLNKKIGKEAGIAGHKELEETKEAKEKETPQI